MAKASWGAPHHTPPAPRNGSPTSMKKATTPEGRRMTIDGIPAATLFFLTTWRPRRAFAFAWEGVGGLAPALANSDGMDYSCSFGCITEHILRTEHVSGLLSRGRPPNPLIHPSIHCIHLMGASLRIRVEAAPAPLIHGSTFHCFHLHSTIYPVAPSGSADWYLVRSTSCSLLHQWIAGGGGVIGSTLCA